MSIIGLVFLYIIGSCIICKVTEKLFNDMSWVIFVFWPVIIIVYLLLLFYFFLFKCGCKITRKVNSIKSKQINKIKKNRR